MRCRRSSAWSWRAGVQSSSRKATFDARVSVIPWRGRLERAHDQLRAVLALERVHGALAVRGRVRAEDVRGAREAVDHRALHGDVLGEDHQRLAGCQEVVDPGKRGGQLAPRGELAQVVEAHELLRAQRGRDLGVDRAQVERQALEPGDHVLLGQPVLVLVREQHRHGVVALRGKLRQHLLLRPPHVAAGAQVPVQAVVAAGAAEAARQAGAAAELAQAPEHPQLRDQLLGPVQHRRAGEGEPQGVVVERAPRARARPSCAGRAGSSRSATRRARARAARAPASRSRCASRMS